MLAAGSAAAQGHHPMNSEPGLVTMNVRYTGSDHYVFHYTVTQQSCPNPSCETNFGKPYRIQIYVDAPGQQSGVGGSPTVESAPPECRSAGGGFGHLVDCNEPTRNQADANAALPMDAQIVVRIPEVRDQATAEIVVEGYSLNTYQAGIPVPRPRCAPEEKAFDDATKAFNEKQEKWTETRRLLIRSENGGLQRFLYGEFYAINHDRLINEFDDAKEAMDKAFLAELAALARLRDCNAAASRLRTIGIRPAQDGDVTAGGCTITQWERLLERAARLELRKLAPTVRKFQAARKAGSGAAAARYRGRIARRLRSESKQVKALDRLIKRTCTS
jgi:hypothetical protein